MVMKTKIVKYGNDSAILLDKEMFNKLQIDENTSIDIFIEDNLIIIYPIKDKDKNKKIQESLKRINKKFSSTLKKLAE